MILTCPNCGTQYVVKDGAIPPEGRQVRCAACKHSWHQDAQEGLAATAEPVSETAVVHQPAEPEVANAPDAVPPQPEASAAAPEAEEPERDESIAEATLIEPRSGPEAEERSYEEAVIEGQAEAPEASAAAPLPERQSAQPTAQAADWNEPPTAEPAGDLYSPFAEQEPLRRSSLVTILLLIALLVAAAAAFWFLAPATLKAKLGIAEANATPLQSVVTHMERSSLESGQDMLTVSGRIINPSPKAQEVPPIQAQLKNHSGQVVKTWTIQPPTVSLAPGASASFNSAEVDVPAGGEQLTLTFGNSRSG